MTSYARTCDPKDVDAAFNKYRRNFGYFADVMVRGAYPADAKAIWEKSHVTMTISGEDKDILKEGKADLLAFSYYRTTCVTTHEELNEVASGNISMGAKNPYLEASQ